MSAANQLDAIVDRVMILTREDPDAVTTEMLAFVSDARAVQKLKGQANTLLGALAALSVAAFAWLTMLLIKRGPSALRAGWLAVPLAGGLGALGYLYKTKTDEMKPLAESLLSRIGAVAALFDESGQLIKSAAPALTGAPDETGLDGVGALDIDFDKDPPSLSREARVPESAADAGAVPSADAGAKPSGGGPTVLFTGGQAASNLLFAANRQKAAKQYLAAIAPNGFSFDKLFESGKGADLKFWESITNTANVMSWFKPIAEDFVKNAKGQDKFLLIRFADSDAIIRDGSARKIVKRPTDGTTSATLNFEDVTEMVNFINSTRG